MRIAMIGPDQRECRRHPSVRPQYAGTPGAKRDRREDASQRALSNRSPRPKGRGFVVSRRLVEGATAVRMAQLFQGSFPKIAFAAGWPFVGAKWGESMGARVFTRAFLVVLTSLCLPATSSAQSQNDALKKYRNYTPSQIYALTEKERQSSVPMVYLMAASTGGSPSSELYLAAQLNQLMYPAVSEYPVAVRAFQHDLGEAETGVFTVGQIADLEYRAGLQSLQSVGFPDFFYNAMYPKFAKLSGTVTIIDDRIAYPINYVEVSCYREGMYCEYDQIVLTLPDKNSWAQTYSVQKFSTDTYDISRWEGDEIDAVASNPTKTPRCRANHLNFNFRTKEFYEITRNDGGSCDVLGSELPKLDKPRVSQIVDGEEIFNREFRALRQKAFDVLASDFRARVDQATAAGGQPKKSN